ncbi:MAG: Firmicu-CTERM sorting domain-containing protein [Acetatifactor sp.]
MKKKLFSVLMFWGLTFLGCMLLPQTAHAAESSPYYGITIDGDFSDWAGVQKYSGGFGVNEVAFVFDGDYLYVYIDEPTQAFSATWSGPNSNGKFALETDLGYQTLFQLTQENGGSVAGVDGALCVHSDTTWGLPGYYWEIAIPASNLGAYNQTVSFGHYLAEGMYVTDVANISGGSTGGDSSETGEEPGGVEETGESGETGGGSIPSEPTGSFDGIVYDGNYDDWLYYPHEVIQYATAGTQENVPDAQAALYSVDGILFGHVVTYMQAHLDEGGGEYTSGITIQINNDWNTSFYPQLVAVDGSGNINYSPQLTGLAQGTYEFYLIDSQGWKNATNISQWTDPMEPYIYGTNAVYGKMMITIGPSKHDMEYWIDIPTLAQKFNMEAGNVQTLSAQYGRIGQQWVTTAGTSTGPVVGLALCMSVVACSVIRKKRSEAGKTA